jgi:hypothetical protein
MGQTLSAPVTDKTTTEDSNTKFAYGSSCMQGWRVCILFIIYNQIINYYYTNLIQSIFLNF